MTLEDAAGGTSYVLDIGGIACDDDVDNDLDSLVDSGADPECDSAVDANERLDGVQSSVASTQPVDIDAAGTMTYEPTELAAPQREQCIDGIGCLGLTIKGLGGTQTGSVTAEGVTLPLPIKIEIDALTGFTGLGADCEIGPIDGVFLAESYDTVTGASHMESNDVPVPAAANCGDWTDGINWYLGLPTLGSSVLETTILDATGQPIQVS